MKDKLKRWWTQRTSKDVARANEESEYYWEHISQAINGTGPVAGFYGARVQEASQPSNNPGTWSGALVGVTKPSFPSVGCWAVFPRLAGLRCKQDPRSVNPKAVDFCGWYPIVLADFDVGYGEPYEPIEARLREAGLPMPSWVVATGGGYHCYWFLERPVRKADLKTVAESFSNIFPEGYDPKPTVSASARAPGSVNAKPKYPEPQWVRFIRRSDPQTVELGQLTIEAPLQLIELAPGEDSSDLAVEFKSRKCPKNLQGFFIGEPNLSSDRKWWTGNCGACGGRGKGYAWRTEKRGEYVVRCHSTHCTRHRQPERVDLGETRVDSLPVSPVDIPSELAFTSREEAAPAINEALDWLAQSTEPGIGVCAVSPGLGKDYHTISRLRRLADPRRISAPKDPKAAELWDTWVRRGRPADAYYKTHKRALPIVYKTNGAELKRFATEVTTRHPEMGVRVEASPVTLHKHFGEDPKYQCKSIATLNEASPALKFAEGGWSPGPYCQDHCPYRATCNIKSGQIQFGGDLGPAVARTHGKLRQKPERERPTAILDEHYPLSTCYTFDITLLNRCLTEASGRLSRGPGAKVAREWLKVYQPTMQALKDAFYDRQRKNLQPKNKYDTRLARGLNLKMPKVDLDVQAAFPWEHMSEDKVEYGWPAEFAYAVQSASEATFFWVWNDYKAAWDLRMRRSTLPDITQHGRVLIMDGTAHLTALGTIPKEYIEKVWQIDANDHMNRTWCNYAVTRSSIEKTMQNKNKTTWKNQFKAMEEWLDGAHQHNLDNAPEEHQVRKLVIATYKSRKKDVKSTVAELNWREKFSLTEIAVDHYEAMVGTNKYSDFDALIMFGQPTRGGEEERKMFESLAYGNADQNIRARAEAAMLRQCEQRLRPLDTSLSPEMGAFKHVLYMAKVRPYHWSEPGTVEEGKATCELMQRGNGLVDGLDLASVIEEWMQLVGACFEDDLRAVFGISSLKNKGVLTTKVHGLYNEYRRNTLVTRLPLFYRGLKSRGVMSRIPKLEFEKALQQLGPHVVKRSQPYPIGKGFFGRRALRKVWHLERVKGDAAIAMAKETRLAVLDTAKELAELQRDCKRRL